MVKPGKPTKQSKAAAVAKSATPSTLPSRAPSPVPEQPFRFFDLAAELRVRVYEEVLRTGILDLEAYRVFYSQTLRLFPHALHGRFFTTKRPLLARLPPHYRAVISRIEVRLGSGWTKPPPGQNTNSSLGLADCTNLRTLQIYVEIDPSESFFDGHRGKYATKDTYQCFCVDLLRGIFGQVPSLETVELDAAPGLKKSSALIIAIEREVRNAGLRLAWASSREWDVDDNDSVKRELLSLARTIAGLQIRDSSRTVEVGA
nr:hypothetical protein CFP56_03741 [Quercus suber]